MEKSYSESYAAAGVDITAGYRSVELMKQYVARTMNEHCIGGLGGFGGLFELDCTGYKHPVLISGTDGVGTKLKIAMIMDKHDTIGIDCVAMCVNDVICAGAKPLVFLDYIACGRNIPEKIAEIVKGVSEGCVQADCSLVGGETAEHPGMMPEDEYDLAGFTVGVVDKEKILNNETMKPGDVIIALPSTGVHSNGFSLVRKIFDIDGDPAVLKTAPAELGGKTLGEALLAPTKIYVKPVLKVLEEVDVKGISHITGCHGLIAQDLFLIHNAHGEAGQIVLLLRHHARVLGSLAAYQCTIGLHAALGHALDDVGDLFRHVAAAGDIIEEHQRLCTGADDIVDAHGHAVDADGVVLIHDHGHLQLGAHTVGAGDQHRVLVTGAIQLKQAAKAAQTADAVLVHGTGDILLHQLHRAVTGGNVHACCGVAFRIALFHVLTLLTFWRPWDGRSGDGREYR